MAFDPALSTAVDRVRNLVGDTADPPQLMGGEARYTAMLTLAASDETAAAVLSLDALIAEVALLPLSRSAEGVSESYDDRRAALSARRSQLAASAAGSGPISFVTAVYRDTSGNDEYSR